MTFIVTDISDVYFHLYHDNDNVENFGKISQDLNLMISDKQWCGMDNNIKQLASAH